MEEKIAENVRVEKVESNTRTGVTAVYITLIEGTKDTGKEFDDIKLKLDTLTDLPDGAGPIEFVKDFGDTSALMLTVASPRADAAEVAARAQALRAAIEASRAAAGAAAGPRVTLAQGIPAVGAGRDGRAGRCGCSTEVGEAEGVVPRRHASLIGPGYRRRRRRAPTRTTRRWPPSPTASSRERLQRVGVPSRRLAGRRSSATRPTPTARLEAVAGDKYSYRELDEYTDLITRTLKTLPIVSKVTRAGLLEERVYLEYSQERLAAYGVKVGLARAHARRPQHHHARRRHRVGRQEPHRRSVGRVQERAGDRRRADRRRPAAASLYLRDVATVARGYESAARS